MLFLAQNTPLASLDLSIVIVNYNVRHFLEQCLHSVFRALEQVQGEVIVVDNHSTDDSLEMLRQTFADRLTLIANQDNPGFSKANNQGMRIARGRYVLLLNPDTVVEEETFRTCVDFMDAHPQAGALGVKMIDGQGKFLPESKRALPTPWVSFYKIFGLSALFPQSKRFGQYHLTYLDQEENHQIEILSGAFMFMRKQTLDEIGLLDETFFMYGEDIDLSYRVILGGYTNHYLADARIIHYKGESTKKGSLNYVRVFYQAMIIFAHKHFGGRSQRVFIAAIRLAVYLRATMAVAYRLAQRYGFALIEGLLIYLTSLGITAYWEYYVKYLKSGVYEPLFRYGYLPVYAAVFVGLLGLLGAYKKPFRLRPLVVAPFVGFVTIATVTYMASFIENYSRAIVGLTSVFTVLIAMATRGLINYREKGNFFFQEPSSRRVLIVGQPTAWAQVRDILRQQPTDLNLDLVGGLTLAPGEAEAVADVPRLGQLGDLGQVLQLFDVDEVVFCQDGWATREILDQLEARHPRKVSFKIAPPDTDFIVGPQQIWTARAWQRPHYRIAERANRLAKRSLDAVGSSLLLLSFPLLFWRYRHPRQALQGLARTLVGQRHLVGYQAPQSPDLPPLKPGLLSLQARSPSEAAYAHPLALDRYYARAYRWELDLETVLKGWRGIGGKGREEG